MKSIWYLMQPMSSLFSLIWTKSDPQNPQWIPLQLLTPLKEVNITVLGLGPKNNDGIRLIISNPPTYTQSNRANFACAEPYNVAPWLCLGIGVARTCRPTSVVVAAWSFIRVHIRHHIGNAGPLGLIHTKNATPPYPLDHLSRLRTLNFTLSLPDQNLIRFQAIS